MAALCVLLLLLLAAMAWRRTPTVFDGEGLLAAPNMSQLASYVGWNPKTLHILSLAAPPSLRAEIVC